MDSVADRFRKVRGQLGLGTVEMARELKIRSASVSQIESGRTRAPAARTILRLQQRFNVNPEYILTGSGPMFLGEIEQTLRHSELLGVIADLTEENRAALLQVARTLLRAQPRPSPSDPFKIDPPKKPRRRE